MEVGYRMLSKSILVYEQCRHVSFSGLLLLIAKLATSSSRLLSIGAYLATVCHEDRFKEDEVACEDGPVLIGD